MKHKGFTIVELVVVIIVIGILVSISIVSYTMVTRDAIDTKIKASVKTVGDAVSLHESQTDKRVYLNGALTNSGGSPATGVTTTLIPKYLKTDYADDLSSNKLAVGNSIILAYDCADGSGGFVVYSSLNNPTAEETSRFNSTRTSCGHDSTTALNAGYNYAKTF